jgi:hypothetical protein
VYRAFLIERCAGIHLPPSGNHSGKDEGVADGFLDDLSGWREKYRNHRLHPSWNAPDGERGRQAEITDRRIVEKENGTGKLPPCRGDSGGVWQNREKKMIPKKDPRTRGRWYGIRV